MFVGGTETTTKSLAQAMIYLEHRPELFAALATDHDTRRRVADESLSRSSPTQGILGTVTRDGRLGSAALRAGDRPFVMFAAANRDPAFFERADEFDHRRTGLGHHLALGCGVHLCLGAALPRLEMQVALGALSRRIRYRILEDPETSYGNGFLLLGPDRLRIRRSPIVSEEVPS